MIPGDQEEKDPLSHGIEDEETKKKIRKHLTDKDDVISEEDIAKVRTDIKSEDHPLAETDEDEDEEEEEASDDEEKPKPEPPSSWEITE
jgi:hypothetical protein